jgi:UDPglucose 6-dehydrogenase/GDP-mannose 6-dehydrogenase
MRVSVIGTGYVGLVSGVCLAETGHHVTCVDIDPAKVDKINRAIPPIYEKGLEELLKRNAGVRLGATTDLRNAVLESDLSLIAVGTPFDGSAIDLKFIREVARQIGEVLKDKPSYHVVVVKSTVVPGTSEDVVLPILEQASGKQAGKDFGVGMNPEFLREGEAVEDFMFPDRIVLGGIDRRTQDVMAELYAVFPKVDKIKTSPKTAEMIKYTANSLLATMISFSNEIGNLCAALGGIDVVDVMRGVHLDKRLTPILEDGRRIVPVFTTYLEAGCGFGGSCFPKDVKALIVHGQNSGQPMQLLESVVEINERQPQQILQILERRIADLGNSRIGILGLAFKPGTDDMRESPAIPIVRELQKRGAQLKAYDPIAKNEAMHLFGHDNIQYTDSLDETVTGVDAVVLLTRWPEFARVPELLKLNGTPPLMIDGRRMLDKTQFERYEGIGLQAQPA